VDSLVNLVVGLIVLAILAIPLIAVYKHRDVIKRWVKEPDYGSLAMWETDGVKRAERGVIKAKWRVEDAEDYLEWKKKKQSKSEKTQEG